MVEPIRVVLVDDHAVFCDALTAVLNLEPDLRVVGRGGTVREALEAVRLHRPDVVLLDVHLPDGSGIDAVQSIKREFPKTQVVMLTSDEEESVLRDAIASGVTGYLSKHESTPQVLQAVRGAARGEALIAPYMLNRLLEGMARPAAPTAAAPLTPRELGVLNELALGHDNLRVAERLGMSPNTVRTHVQNILAKLKVHSKLEAVTRAMREGWISLPEQPAA
jgi:DNA-binding NarL/FixJ family response regulator